MITVSSVFILCVEVLSTKYILFATGAIIGFENIAVSVQEGTGVIVVYVAVLNGTLGRDVTVRFSTADLSATGEPYILSSAIVVV